MTAPHGQQIVAGYLAQLELALAGVPDRRRSEILAEIRDHIALARAQIPDESDAAVYNVLERLGDPAEIAAAASAGEAQRDGAIAAAPSTGGWVDVAAVVLTPILWPAGVILLWMSSAWSTRDKLIGTLVPPGGYFGTFVGMSYLFLIGHTVGGGCGGGVDSTGNATTSCWGVMALPAVVQFFLYAAEMLVFLLWLVLPVLTGIYMAVRLRRGMRRSPAGAGNLVPMQSR